MLDQMKNPEYISGYFEETEQETVRCNREQE
mgnify:CR=1 FL=1